MSRNITDPRVQTIIAALDRAALCPDAHEIVPLVASVIITWHYTCGEEFWGWPADAARAIALAYAQHAPEDELEGMAAKAEEEIRWCEWWDRAGRAIASGEIPEPGVMA